MHGYDKNNKDPFGYTLYLDLDEDDGTKKDPKSDTEREPYTAAKGVQPVVYPPNT